MCAVISKRKDEEELRAKKFIDYGKFARKNCYKFIDYHIGSYYTKTAFSKDKNSKIKKESNRFINKNQHIKNTEVLVKITSNSKNQNAIYKHLEYISRNGSVETLVTDLNYCEPEFRDTISGQYHLMGKEYLKFTHSFYEEKIDLSKSKNARKAQRLTFNMVFSLKDYQGIDEFSFDPELVKKATFYTIKKFYPNNFFVLALHTDTNNPHCHICLKTQDENGKRIDIRKADLHKLREEFAKNLNNLGLEATATRKYERNTEKYISSSLYKDKVVPDFYPNAIKERNDPRFAPNQLKCFEIVDFGNAPYEFMQGNPQSYFITYLTKDFRKVSIWGQDLERIVKENNLKKGDFAKFHKIGRAYKMKSYEKIVKNSLYEINEPIYYSKWDCIVYDMEKKSLSKDKFEKLAQQEVLKPSVKFIKKISKEHNARKPRRPDSSRHYTKEEWAKYHQRRGRKAKRALQTTSSLYKSEFNFDECRGFNNLAPREFDSLRTLPQSSMDFTKREESKNTDLFLSSDAYPKLFNAQSQDYTELRWTASSSSGIRSIENSRENLERG
ncbi:MobP1 family relaxase [Campylobacter upsaliensis]|uniref:Cpp17 n=1 Tax=Campylobacter upsaliensis TaxID=28080 RepID=A0A381F3N5_CAMUP|nr:MobP1 family relaxase [Campylobacter upsaliensis]EAL52598.1 nickase [Campylobacter upsaliensis RM3195]MCR2108895.1 relaxase/mobilization nuclease domain-containing protein [Campylobacter upsaliensis]MCR2110011.1 relaxase/mobilization nuclease domain-containing protein [Campylobacter upsaliensis]MCR2113751.1 relaxase/mobilization nuclease domain-containing protein [Campylobacter upsaliensis]MCR2115748.1 relaxase/mobilization nuclease domain-containing protein [Campylobacter upsaliensis]